MSTGVVIMEDVFFCLLVSADFFRLLVVICCQTGSESIILPDSSNS